ncbi:MAG: hypothetical protein ACMXYM_03390 [Candidatus Woesearchaeota archaeon]
MKREQGILIAISLLIATMCVGTAAHLMTWFLETTQTGVMIASVGLTMLASALLWVTILAFVISIFLPRGEGFKHPVLAAVFSSDEKTIAVIGVLLISFASYQLFGWPEGELMLGHGRSLKAEDWWWIMMLGFGTIGFAAARITSRFSER